MIAGNKLDLVDDDECRLAVNADSVRRFAADRRLPYVLLCARDTDKVRSAAYVYAHTSMQVRDIFKQLVYSTSASLATLAPSEFEQLKKRRQSLPENPMQRGSRQFDAADFERIQRAAGLANSKRDKHKCVVC
jgi:hypothetical protein